MRILLFLTSFVFSISLPAEILEGKITTMDSQEKTAHFEASGKSRIIQLLPGDIQINWTGRVVRCTFVDADGKTRANLIFPADSEELRQIAEVTEALRRDTVERGRVVTRGANDLMPPMALWDQQAQLRFKKDYLGQPLAINFIFTSCRNAQMCPASTSCMKRLADELDKSPELNKVKLISITFDPENDSPGILNAYAEGYGIKSSRHSFLTGNSAQIKDLMRHYGILTTRADGTIVHNAALIIVSPEGRIIQRREGAQFDPVDVAEYFRTYVQLSSAK